MNAVGEEATLVRDQGRGAGERKLGATWTVMTVVLALVTTTLVSLLYDEVDAAVPARAAAAVSIQMDEQDVQVDMECGQSFCHSTRRGKRLQRKIRNDDVATASGFSPKRAFKKPKKARYTILRRTRTVLERRSPGHGPQWYGERAVDSYQGLLLDSKCAITEGQVPNNGWGLPQSCRWRPTYRWNEIRQKKVVTGLWVVACGSAVAFGVAGSGGLGVAAAGNAMSGAAGCGLSYALTKMD